LINLALNFSGSSSVASRYVEVAQPDQRTSGSRDVAQTPVVARNRAQGLDQKIAVSGFLSGIYRLFIVALGLPRLSAPRVFATDFIERAYF
jgi:hypothetical protein